MKHWLIIVISISLAILLFGISDGRQARRSLVHYLAEVKRRPAKTIVDVPLFESSPSFRYTAATLRDPFLPINKGVNLPQMAGQRVTEPLEAFSIDALHMVGTIQVGENIWALIAASDGNIYKITIGNYIGQNQGQVTAITKDKITLVEKFYDGQSWHERPVTLLLASHSAET